MSESALSGAGGRDPQIRRRPSRFASMPTSSTGSRRAARAGRRGSTASFARSPACSGTGVPRPSCASPWSACAARGHGDSGDSALDRSGPRLPAAAHSRCVAPYLPARIELATSPLRKGRSIQLSYKSTLHPIWRRPDPLQGVGRAVKARPPADSEYSVSEYHLKAMGAWMGGSGSGTEEEGRAQTPDLPDIASALEEAARVLRRHARRVRDYYPAPEAAAAILAAAEPGAAERGAAKPTARQVRAIVAVRRLRAAWLPDLSGDHAFSMLLELYAAHLEGRRIAQTRLG